MDLGKSAGTHVCCPCVPSCSCAVTYAHVYPLSVTKRLSTGLHQQTADSGYVMVNRALLPIVTPFLR